MMDVFSVCAVLWLREKACSILTKTEACRTLKVRVLLSFNPLQTRSLHIKTCVPSPSTGHIYGTNMNKSRNTAACSTSFFLKGKKQLKKSYPTQFAALQGSLLNLKNRKPLQQKQLVHL